MFETSIIWFYGKENLSFFLFFWKISFLRYYFSSLDCLSTTLYTSRWTFIHHLQFSLPKENDDPQYPLGSPLTASEESIIICSHLHGIWGTETGRAWQCPGPCVQFGDTKALDEHVTCWRACVGLGLGAGGPAWAGIRSWRAWCALLSPTRCSRARLGSESLPSAWVVSHSEITRSVWEKLISKNNGQPLNQEEESLGGEIWQRLVAPPSPKRQEEVLRLRKEFARKHRVTK